VAIANFFVWSLFAIITIVYSEDILATDVEVNVCPGRVPASNEELESDTHTLSVIYQSIVIFFTFIFGVIFWFMSYRLFKVTSKGSFVFKSLSFCHLTFGIPGVSKAKQFIFRIGAILVTCFMLRCIFFIILLAVDFTSAIYLFIILMITEVIMMFLIQLEFNKRFYKKVFFGDDESHMVPSGANLSANTRTGSSQSVRVEGSTVSPEASSTTST
jgi:hypothetical protein